MARHYDEIVVFFIDPTTNELGEVHEIKGWMKDWFTFGNSKGVQAAWTRRRCSSDVTPDVLDSVSGPQQGDPFGPFLFSITIGHPRGHH
jgi:hypothetical protein